MASRIKSSGIQYTVTTYTKVMSLIEGCLSMYFNYSMWAD